MKMKQISDSTIKITMMMEDLAEHGMELADFLVPQEKTEDFFYTILDELDMPDNFLESGMLSFRVTPKPDRLDVFVTKSKVDQSLDFDDFGDFADEMNPMAHMSPDDFIKQLEQNILAHSKDDLETIERLAQEEAQEEAEVSEEEVEAQERYIYYILQFKTLQEAIDYAKLVDYEVDTSELYKMNDEYYLTILVNVEDQPRPYPAWLLARMREHAEDTEISRSYLQEHGYIILVNDAVQNLTKVTY